MAQIRELTVDDASWLRTFLLEHFGSTRVVSRGVLHRVGSLPGFVALSTGEPAGLLSYSVVARELEVVTLHAAVSGQGIGSALLAAARERATDLACTRLWLITTNDNRPAIRFYERAGLTLAQVHRGAVAEARRIKPEIPKLGYGGVPIEDELEFEVQLPGAVA
jgi:ribosomal protein S18 acetylase RimI-like enzyme